MAGEKKGALTKDDFLEIWKSATDKNYNEPFLEAGEGEGLEVHTQMMEQFARASEAIDVTTQALFVSPSSGQTNDPAGGARNARVRLSFTRTLRHNDLLILRKGQVFFEEKNTDWGKNGGEEVLTGRVYVLDEDVFFPPGVSGPLLAWAVADRPGYGYNNPLPGTISYMRQPGAALANEHATVTVVPPASLFPGSTAVATVIAPNAPDMFVPENLGQYLFFTAGTNAGRMGRVVTFFPPNLALPFDQAGSRVQLSWDYALQGTITGTFLPNEPVTFSAGPPFATGTFLNTTPSNTPGQDIVSVQLLIGTHTSIAPGNTLLGTLSGATLTVTSVLHDGSFVQDIPPAPGVAGASWRFLDWVTDFGLEVSNAEKPTLGRSAMLDALGWERGVSRALGEDDESYRRRVLAISDTVSPNAIKRTAARVMGNVPWCYREVGAVGMRGEFFDGDLSGPSATPHGAMNDAYDTTVAITQVPSLMPIIGAGFQAPVEIRGATSGELVGTGWFGRYSFAPDTVNIIMRRKPRSVAEPLELHFMLGGAPFVLAVVSQTVAASWDLRKDRVMFNYEQFRGFFQICVPPLGYGEFGIAFDVGTHNAFDIGAPYQNFFDGYPYLNATVLSRLYQAVDEVHAGGVAFDLCLDSTCLTPNG